MLIREAHQDEWQQLSALAKRSKAYWGYDSDFLIQCDSALSVTATQLQSHLHWFWVCVIEDKIIGFVGLSKIDQNRVELDHLFIEPTHMKQGIGSVLFHHAVSKAKKLGFYEMHILSDPFAANFYKACGARFIEHKPSDAIEGRELPFFVYDL